MAFGWFIYDVNYNGKPQIDWIWETYLKQ
jgi:hypothetical protein